MMAGPRAQASDSGRRHTRSIPTATLEIENTNGAIDVRTHTQPTIMSRPSAPPGP